MRRLGRLLIATISVVTIVSMVTTGARVSARYINKGRSPQNCIARGCVSARPSDTILRDDVYINRHVTPRRGTHEGGECVLLRPLRPLRPMRRLGRLLIATISTVSMVTMVITCRVRSGHQQGRINKGRSPQNCIARSYVSMMPSDAILRDDVYIMSIISIMFG